MTDPVVALHGFTGSPRSFDRVAAALSPQPPAFFAPALLGHGATGASEVVSFEGEVERLARLIAERGASWHLVGYSLGGRVAIGLLARHPALFSGATLIGAQPGLDDEAARQERREADARWSRLLEEKGIVAFVDEWANLPLFDTQRALPPDVLQAQREERLGHRPDGLERSLEVLGLGAMPSYRDALPGITVPTTCIAGQCDEKFTVIARDMCRLMPRSTLEVVADAGHNVVLEQPQAVARAVSRSVG
jgi:2-succinyl-6-hydroxy-2,4-cyclohexadiene-1-carboxylate synthase